MNWRRLGVGNRIEDEFIKMATRAVGGRAFLGAGFLLKQPAAIAAVPLGIYLLLPTIELGRSLTRTNSIIQATILTAGILRRPSAWVTIVLWSKASSVRLFYWTIADHDVPYCVFGRRDHGYGWASSDLFALVIGG